MIKLLATPNAAVAAKCSSSPAMELPAPLKAVYLVGNNSNKQTNKHVCTASVRVGRGRGGHKASKSSQKEARGKDKDSNNKNARGWCGGLVRFAPLVLDHNLLPLASATELRRDVAARKLKTENDWEGE